MSLSRWPAPLAGRPVDATVRVPGSKSVTNRVLLLAALADGSSTLHQPLRARDTDLMAGALRALGVQVSDGPDGSWQVAPAPLAGPAEVDCGLAGTVMRFVPPVATLATGDVRLDGDPRARERPMGPVLSSLRQLGAHIEDAGRDALPFTVRGQGGLSGGAVDVDASGSSQFVSALLLAGARYDKGLVVTHTGAPLPSLPHVRMTVELLRLAGIVVDDSVPDRWVVEAGDVRARDVVVEPDLSNAAPFLAAALVTGGRVTVPDWPAHTTQAGDALRELLTAMGGTYTVDGTGLTFRGSGTVRGLDADLHDVGELTPVLAALAALADGPSHLRGIAHLRHHETDRLAALAAEINKLGGAVTETDDGLRIVPTPLRGSTWRSYADHRMASAGALLGLVVSDVTVEDVETTRKTLPDFPGMWAAMLGDGQQPA